MTKELLKKILNHLQNNTSGDPCYDPSCPCEGEENEVSKALVIEIEEVINAVFRKYVDNGDLLVLFPYENNYADPEYYESYQHIGQHSAAHYKHCLSITDLAKPEEYAALKRELEGIGYNLDIRKRV